ncbi:hypothetical protein Tco_0428976 [Tanacetum coccineum]
MACVLPHTDSEVKALVQKLINEDKGPQDVLLNLVFQLEDSGAFMDDLRKAYEKCNDIPRESRALICTLLKESFEKDRKLHLSMYGKAAQVEKQMEAKLAWFQEKYSCRTHGEMLEEEAMNKKAQEEKIRQEQAKNDAFFLEFGVVRSSSLAVTSSGLSSDVFDAGLPLEKVMSSGKNGDDGDLLLCPRCPGACDGRGRTLGLAIGLLGVECPVAAFCSEELSSMLLESD